MGIDISDSTGLFEDGTLQYRADVDPLESIRNSISIATIENPGGLSCLLQPL